MKYAQSDIKKLGTILGIWAHPDDEAFSMAGLMSYARRNGQRVVIVTATLGEAGQSADESRWPKAKLGQIRKGELAESLRISGVTESYLLGYLDGTLKDQDMSWAVPKIIDIIERVKPNTVISFNQDGITGHDDHKTIHLWAKKAVEQSKTTAQLYCAVECKETYDTYGREYDHKFNVHFNVDEPETHSKHHVDICLDLDEQARRDKEQAIRAHACQTAKMFKNTADQRLLMETVCICECFLRVI